MKRNATSTKLPSDFPRTRADVEALIARAPKSVPYDPTTDAYDPNDPAAVARATKNAVAVRGGGPRAVREALAARRGRGPGKRPAKALLSLRLPPQTLARWKSSGPGWQTRMAELLTRRAPR